MDTRDVLVVTPTSDGTSVDLEEVASNQRMDAWFGLHGRRKVGPLAAILGFCVKVKARACAPGSACTAGARWGHEQLGKGVV